MRTVICATLSLAAAVLLACNPAPQAVTIDKLVPADKEVGSWALNPSAGSTGVAKTKLEAEALVNGAADPFVARGLSAFARYYYKAGTYSLELRIWQMKDATTTKEVYDYLVTGDPLYKALTWDNAAVGEAGRVANTGAQWWFNCRKGTFQVEVTINPNDAQGKTDGQAFAAAVVGKIP